MLTPTGSMPAVLAVARDNGSVYDAINAGGTAALRTAELLGYLNVFHRLGGGVSAETATNRDATTVAQQRNDLTVQLTDAGRDHLAGAR
jgi:hypothetical protein